MKRQHLPAGVLDRRVRIEKLADGLDPDYGTPVQSWIPVAEVWAELLDLLAGSRERLAGDLHLAEATVRVRLRWRSDLTADMRLVELGGRGRVLQLVAPPAELGRAAGLELACKEWTA